jgi:hypothetical protein
MMSPMAIPISKPPTEKSTVSIFVSVEVLQDYDLAIGAVKSPFRIKDFGLLADASFIFAISRCHYIYLIDTDWQRLGHIALDGEMAASATNRWGQGCCDGFPVLAECDLDLQAGNSPFCALHPTGNAQGIASKYLLGW